MKFKVRDKIFITLLGLSIISLFIYAYVSYIHMKGLGSYALESNVRLRDYAVNDSIKALKEDNEEFLLKIAYDYAFIMSAALENGKMETNFMATYASGLWNNLSSIDNIQSYSQQEKSEDIYPASGYVLAPGISINEVSEELNISSNMDAIFIAIYANEKVLDSVYIGTESGIFRKYPWESGISISFDPREREWYKRAVETGDIGWTKPYIDAYSKEPMVSCSKPFYGPEGELIGVVGMDVTLKTMNESIKDAKVGELGYTFVIDSIGDVIARPELSAEDRRWDETFGLKNLMESDNPKFKEIVKNMISANTGLDKCEFKEGERYIAYTPLKHINWSLGIVLPIEEVIAPAQKTKSAIVASAGVISDDINRRIENLLKILIFAFILVIFIVVLVAYRLSKRITRPIVALDNGARIVGSGNLDYRLEVKTGDEIEELANNFNRMTDDLKIYMKNLREATAARERVESELKIARKIQFDMLPRIFPPFPDRKEIDIYATMQPAREVGGDFYDFFFIDKKNFCFVIGDVSGKGVPAALFMAIIKSLVKMVAVYGASSEEILYKVNKILYPGNDACMFATIQCAILNTETGEVYLANGGHNPPLIYTEGKEYESVEIPKSTFIGAVADIKIGTRRLTLRPNNVVFMYTDGVTESMNKEEQLFTDKRLEECLSDFKDKGLADIIHGVKKEIDTFTEGTPQSDDITMLALRFNG